MADDPTTLTDAPPRPDGVPPVLDEAHIGDIRGALGTISMHDSGLPARTARRGPAVRMELTPST